MSVRKWKILALVLASLLLLEVAIVVFIWKTKRVQILTVDRVRFSTSQTYLYIEFYWKEWPSQPLPTPTAPVEE